MNSTGILSGKYKPLGDDDIKKIHKTSLYILENVGMYVPHREALRIFSEGGALVDFETAIVRFSPELVEDVIARAPSKVTLCGRDPENDLHLEDYRVYAGTGGSVVSVYDLRSGVKRSSTLSDVSAIARVVDSLRHIDFLIIPVYPNDIPSQLVDINKFFHSLANTTKHVMSGVASRDKLLDVIKLGEMIAGGREKLLDRPLISIITNAMSPLRFEDTATDILIEAAKYGLPVTCAPAPMSGATAPMTLAGTLAQQNAESLVGIILTQMINPGTPVLYGAVPAPVDPRTMNFLFGAVEMGLLNACAVQLARYYKLPIYASAGPSDSKLPDAQSGWEKGINILMVALAGGNYIHLAAGMLEGGLAVAYEQYIMDNDILGSIMRALRGVEISEDTLAAQVIAKVGPGGDYLLQEHTVKYMRSEIFFPDVADRNNYTVWLQQGAKDVRQRAKERAWQLLEEYRCLPLDRTIEKQIRNHFNQIVDINY